MDNLKGKTIRGGLARLCSQMLNFIFRIGSLMVLARLLSPKDFGLVGMVTAFTGILSLFRDFGLSAAAVQRETITEEQMSALFWINILVSIALGLLALAMAPAIAGFYHEPRLSTVTAALATAFVFNGAGVQHSALLQRQMRFTAMAVINTVSLMVATAFAIGTAKAGDGYWALVVQSVTLPLISTIGFWFTTGWIPGKLKRKTEIRSMMQFGGTITLNGLLAYLAYNCEKILLGRFWGADAIGVYGRAYQLSNIPTDNLNSAIGEVAFSALSRVRLDAKRFRNYFLKGYSLVLSLTVPITLASFLFAEDVISVLLGPQWKAAIPIFRLLAPTILIFAIINPLGWLMWSLGMVRRSLKIAMVFAPLIIAGYLLGLPYGPQGVAFAYSAVMVLWVVPHIAWCVHGTAVTFRDVVLTAACPIAVGLVAGAVAWIVGSSVSQLVSPVARLILETTVLFTLFAGILIFATGQRSFYLDLLRGLRVSPSDEGKLVSAYETSAR